MMIKEVEHVELKVRHFKSVWAGNGIFFDPPLACKESQFHNKKINHSASDPSCINNHNIKKLFDITDFGIFTLKKFPISNFFD